MRIAGCVLIAAGAVIFFFTVLGLFRFNVTMNRMHSAAMGESLGFGVIMLGLALINGIQMSSLKFICAGLLLFFASSVCSHIIARSEYETNVELRENCREEDRCS